MVADIPATWQQCQITRWWCNKPSSSWLCSLWGPTTAHWFLREVVAGCSGDLCWWLNICPYVCTLEVEYWYVCVYSTLEVEYWYKCVYTGGWTLVCICVQYTEGWILVCICVYWRLKIGMYVCTVHWRFNIGMYVCILAAENWYLCVYTGAWTLVCICVQYTGGWILVCMCVFWRLNIGMYVCTVGCRDFHIFSQIYQVSPISAFIRTLVFRKYNEKDRHFGNFSRIFFVTLKKSF